MNGKVDSKYLVTPKPLFGFAPKPAPVVAEPSPPVEVPEPERAKDTILVKDGKALFVLYGLIRYYLYLEKYKAIVKCNLNHRAYFSKRDEIIKLG